MKREQKRNLIGLAGMFLLACVFGIITEPFMIAREYYQYRRYKLNAFEWDDVIRYTVAILLGTAFNYFTIINIF